MLNFYKWTLTGIKLTEEEVISILKGKNKVSLEIIKITMEIKSF